MLTFNLETHSEIKLTNCYELHCTNCVATVLLLDLAGKGPPVAIFPPPVLHVDSPHHQLGLGGAGAAVWATGVLQPWSGD